MANEMMAVGPGMVIRDEILIRGINRINPKITNSPKKIKKVMRVDFSFLISVFTTISQARIPIDSESIGSQKSSARIEETG